MAVLMAVCLFFLLERSILPGLSGKNPADDRMKLIANAAYLIRDEYVEEPSPAETMEGAFKGAVESLDILSGYLDREAVAKYLQHKSSGLFEPGLILFKNQGRFPLVVAVEEGSPAARKGIQVGETISAIDGRSTLMMSMTEVNLNLKHESAKPVLLKVLRGRETRFVQLDRALLFERVYSFTPMEKLSGILRIHRFFPPCSSSIRKNTAPSLASFQEPLVLDLRHCSEGEIGEAQAFLSLLLNQENIGHLQKRGDVEESISLQNETVLGHLPLVVWTSRATIGPAEVVAGVLKEFKDVRIIGRQTPGLVAQQKFIPLEDGSGLVLTSSVFHLNGKTPIWKKGIKPDIEIKADDPAFNAYLEKTMTLIANL